MSFESHHPGTLGRYRTETTETHDTVPDPTDGAVHGCSPRGETGDSRSVPRSQSRVVSLKAEVKLLEAERETLANQVLALETDVADLEEEVAALEQTIESKDQRRQRMIDKYEEIIAEKDEAYQELQEESDGTTEASIWSVSGVRSSLRSVVARAKHFVPNG